MKHISFIKWRFLVISIIVVFAHSAMLGCNYAESREGGVDSVLVENDGSIIVQPEFYWESMYLQQETDSGRRMVVQKLYAGMSSLSTYERSAAINSFNEVMASAPRAVLLWEVPPIQFVALFLNGASNMYLAEARFVGGELTVPPISTVIGRRADGQMILQKSPDWMTVLGASFFLGTNRLESGDVQWELNPLTSMGPEVGQLSVDLPVTKNDFVEVGNGYSLVYIRGIYNIEIEGIGEISVTRDYRFSIVETDILED